MRHPRHPGWYPKDKVSSKKALPKLPTTVISDLTSSMKSSRCVSQPQRLRLDQVREVDQTFYDKEIITPQLRSGAMSPIQIASSGLTSGRDSARGSHRDSDRESHNDRVSAMIRQRDQNISSMSKITHSNVNIFEHD